MSLEMFALSGNARRVASIPEDGSGMHTAQRGAFPPSAEHDRRVQRRLRSAGMLVESLRYLEMVLGCILFNAECTDRAPSMIAELRDVCGWQVHLQSNFVKFHCCLSPKFSFCLRARSSISFGFSSIKSDQKIQIDGATFFIWKFSKNQIVFLFGKFRKKDSPPIF